MAQRQQEHRAQRAASAKNGREPVCVVGKSSCPSGTLMEEQKSHPQSLCRRKQDRCLIKDAHLCVVLSRH